MCDLIICMYVCIGHTYVYLVRAPRIFRFARKIIKTSTKTSKQDEVLIYAAARFTHLAHMRTKLLACVTAMRMRTRVWHVEIYTQCCTNSFCHNKLCIISWQVSC